MPSLCQALSAQGIDASIRTVNDGQRISLTAATLSRTPIAHPRDRLTGPLLRGSAHLRAALEEDARCGAILHTHGVWLLPNLYPAWIKAQLPATHVVHAPRGMLSSAALAISPWRKRVLWHLWQRRALALADCIHVTAPAECAEIRALGLTNPVAVVPNGIDIPEWRREPKQAGDPARSRTVLSLGRIHPKKGLPSLLRAWARVESFYPLWRLRIVGPDEAGHAAELERLAQSLGLTRVRIEGAVYGPEKAKVYRDADVFVLATLNENFGIAVAEALAAEVPVITTKGAPWSGLQAEGCGWWIDHGDEPLAVTLAEAMAIDDVVRAAMGARGRSWMERAFSWRHVAHDMQSVYRWLRGEEGRPAFVHFPEDDKR